MEPNYWFPYLFKEKSGISEKCLIILEYFVSENDMLWNKSEEEIAKIAKPEAIKLDIIKKDSVQKFKSVKMQKAYPSYFGTYNKIDDIKQYLDSIKNLYYIRINGQHRYNNMDYSMLTEIETANNILIKKI